MNHTKGLVLVRLLHMRTYISSCSTFICSREDYIDLYLVHSPLSGKKRRLETWRALIEQRNQGKFKSIGVSN